jgi:hypothetical protein
MINQPTEGSSMALNSLRAGMPTNLDQPSRSESGDRDIEDVFELAFMPNITKSGHEPIVSGIQIYDSRANRKAIFNRGMVPNIPENPRGRKIPKRGRNPIFDPAIFQERFQTIERVFAWEE